MSATNLDTRTLSELQLQWKQSITGSAKRVVTWADLSALLEDSLQDRLVLEQRIVALETAILALQQRPALVFSGVHSEAKSYVVGDAVVRAGALWACVIPTAGPFTHSAFQLVVKRGAANDAA